MSEYHTQRNVLLTVIAAVGAILLGFLLGRTTGDDRAPIDAYAATQPGIAPADVAATATLPPAEAPAVTASPRPSSPASRPVVGERTTPPPPAPRPSVVEPPAPRVVSVSVPAGTQIELDLSQALSSQTAAVGDTVLAEVAETIWVDGRAAIPAGSLVSGQVTEAQAIKKIGGRATLGVTFDHIEVPGDEAAITAAWRREGKSETAKDAATIAAGAAVGTVAGNQAKKNDKGKVIGAILGAGIGTVIAAKTEGEAVELPAGSRLTLTLRDPVEVRVKG